MAKTPERKVKDKVVAQLKALGAYYFYPVTSGFGTSGVFDIVVCHKGVFIGIECKADAKAKGPTKLQSLNACKAVSSCAIVLLLDNSNYTYLTTVLKKVEGLTHGSREELGRLSIWPFDGVIS